MKNKQRHGCATTWLLLVIFANSFSTVLTLFSGDVLSQSFAEGISNTSRIIMVGIGICNVFFAISLFQWKKWAFWGLVITSITLFGIYLNLGMGVVQASIGLFGIAILYGLLQLKKDNITSWNNLE